MEHSKEVRKAAIDGSVEPERAIACALVYVGDSINGLDSGIESRTLERLAAEVGSIAVAINNLADEVGA